MTILSQKRVVLVGVSDLSLCRVPHFDRTRLISVGVRVSAYTDWILQNSDAGQWQCDWMLYFKLYYKYFCLCMLCMKNQFFRINCITFVFILEIRSVLTTHRFPSLCCQCMLTLGKKLVWLEVASNEGWRYLSQYLTWMIASYQNTKDLCLTF